MLALLDQHKRLDDSEGKWLMLDEETDQWVDAPVEPAAEVGLSDYKLSHSAGYSAEFCAEIRAGKHESEGYDSAALCSPDEYLGLWNDPLVPMFGDFPAILAERRAMGVEAWREKRKAALREAEASSEADRAWKREGGYNRQNIMARTVIAMSDEDRSDTDITTELARVFNLSDAAAKLVLNRIAFGEVLA